MEQRPGRWVDTHAAIVAKISNELIEVRFKPGVRLNTEGIAEMMEAKRALCGKDMPDVLMVTPAEIDLEVAILSSPHPVSEGDLSSNGRLAIAAQSEFNLRLAEIYFKYRPRKHATAIFMTEDEARAWLTGEKCRG